MIVGLVVAVAQNGVIGREGGLPWHIPSDLKRFRAITMGKPVIMGRRTWDSLPRRPLPGRRNIVISRSPSYNADGAEVVATVHQALSFCAGEAEVAVIGGGEIYLLFWPYANRIYLTEVDLAVDGDTHFPKIDPAEWIEVSREVHGKVRGDSAGFTLRVLDRREPARHH